MDVPDILIRLRAWVVDMWAFARLNDSNYRASHFRRWGRRPPYWYICDHSRRHATCKETTLYFYNGATVSTCTEGAEESDANEGRRFAVGATSGPLLGGILADFASWRWCFFMNLPAGVLTCLAFLPYFFCSRSAAEDSTPLREKLLSLDVVGGAILLGTTTMLFAALQFASEGESWGNKRPCGLLVASGITCILLVIWNTVKGDKALFPPFILKQRPVLASCGMAFTSYGVLLLHSYFLPLWFQAVLGLTAFESGLDMIPYIVINAIFTIVAAAFVSRVGYYIIPAVSGGNIATIGCGLLTLLSPNMPTAAWVGLQIPASVGLGLALQQCFIATQAALPKKDIPVGTAMVVASQSLGGALTISIGNCIFHSRLLAEAQGIGLPSHELRNGIDAGATAFRGLFSGDVLSAWVTAYNDSLRSVFITSIPLAGLAVVCACFMGTRSIRAP